MPQVGLKSTIPAFERANRDAAVTAISTRISRLYKPQLRRLQKEKTPLGIPRENKKINITLNLRI
jgi:hypothetical protein